MYQHGGAETLAPEPGEVEGAQSVTMHVWILKRPGAAPAPRVVLKPMVAKAPPPKPAAPKKKLLVMRAVQAPAKPAAKKTVLKPIVAGRRAKPDRSALTVGLRERRG